MRDYTLVAKVLELMDENERLEEGLRRASAELDRSPVRLSGVDIRMARLGRERCFEECYDRYSSVRDYAGGGNVGFAEWARDRAFKSLPDFLSKEQAVRYFDTELKAEYERKVGEAERMTEE